MATTEGNITTLKHAKSGATCKIHHTGATVISFVSGDGRENLFLSKQAKLDGSKAIRGGIPICFPIFGPPTHPKESTMPQHGFARVNAWQLVSSYDREDSAGAVFSLELKDAKEGRGENNPWSISQARVDGTDCKLSYEIRLEGHELTTTLVVKNTGSDSFDFQCLLHNYLKVDGGCAADRSKCSVHGLGGYAITDKVSGDSGHVQSYDEDVELETARGGEVDRVYIHPDDHPTIHAVVDVGCDSSRKVVVRVEAGGQVDGNVAPVSAVVWNPGPAKARDMSDFGDSEYADVICVEPGLIGHQPILSPGAEARVTQSVIVENK